MDEHKMLYISKDKNKRRKGIAIATAQLLFHIDPDVDPDQDINKFISILEGQTDSVLTAYGWTSENEVAQLILEEGLDTEEVKRRILHYKGRRHLADKKKRKDLKSDISDYLSGYCQKSKTYDGLFDQIKFFPETRINYFDSDIHIDRENIVEMMKALTEKEKSEIVTNVNARIDQGDAGDILGNELEKYLNDVGEEYGIESYIDEFEIESKNYFSFKIYIGNRGLLSSFYGTFKELEKALGEEVKVEAADKATCPFCKRKIIRYVAMNKIKNCECGARIVVTPYMVKKQNVIYSRQRVSFKKPE